MIPSYAALGRRWLMALAVVAAVLVAPEARAADLFGTIDASTLLVRAKVEAVTPYEAA